MTLKYRWSLIGSFICCLCVAVLWGANLGAVYPFVEIVLHDKSLHEWVDDRSEKSTAAITELESKIAELKADGGLGDQIALPPDLSRRHI